SQAIDALGALVTAAAGNEGGLPVHGEASIEPSSPRDFGVIAASNLSAPTAYVEIWADSGARAPAQVALAGNAAIEVQSSTVGAGDTGRTEALFLHGRPAARVKLDAEPMPNPFNGKTHLRVELSWSATAAGAAIPAVRLRGTGHFHLWVDGPADQ